MKRRFEELKEIIEFNRNETMPVKYVMLGRIMQAMEDDKLTIKEAWKLEEILDIQGTEDYDKYREYGLMGPDPAEV